MFVREIIYYSLSISGKFLTYLALDQPRCRIENLHRAYIAIRKVLALLEAVLEPHTAQLHPARRGMRESFEEVVDPCVVRSPVQPAAILWALGLLLYHLDLILEVGHFLHHNATVEDPALAAMDLRQLVDDVLQHDACGPVLKDYFSSCSQGVD
jgi:hypothetical protein